MSAPLTQTIRALSSGSLSTGATYQTPQRAASLLSADFNNDGIPDLALVNRGSTAPTVILSQVTILLGNGNGTFQAPVNYSTGAISISLVAADINEDGNTDLIAANPAAGTLSVMTGKGDGTFNASVTLGMPAGPQSLAVADYNGDGLPDLISADADGSVYYL